MPADRATILRIPGARGRRFAGCFAILWLAAGCTARDDRTLVVLAASSLTEALDEATGAFAEAHPPWRVEISFAGSQALRLQVEHGTRADVFASASPRHTDALRRAGLVEPPVPLGTNALAVVSPADRPVRDLADLPSARRVVLAGPDVPAGRYADRFLARADAHLGPGYADAVRRHVVSREPNVRAVLAKVLLGEADAAVVYATDARTVGRDRLTVTPIDDPALAIDAAIEIAVVAGGPRRDGARTLVGFLAGAPGQAVLARHGFLPPRDRR